MTMTITPPIQKLQTVRHTINRLLALCLALVFAPLPAGAAGLGNVSGNPVMGEPFVLEVPLIDAGDLAAECIQLTPHSAGSDSQFFPRKATFDLKKKAGGAQTVITIRGAEFTQPVLEFRLTIGCGNQISRDYALLPSPSRELHYEPVQINRAAVMPVPESPSSAVVKNLGNAAAPAGRSLEKMAKQRYPLQPKARAKFKRMVRDANPAALEGVADNAPLPANADLQIPANIPKKRVGPYIPKVKKAPPAPAPTQIPSPAEPAPPAQTKAPAPSEKPAPAPVAAETPKDRLIISSGAGAPGAIQPVGTAEGALQEKAAASFTAQEDLVAKLAQSESSYNELKQQILAMESRMAVLEQERQRLQQEAMKKSDWPLLETTVLILVGGLLGAMLMIIMQRRRSYETPTFDIGAIGRK